MGLKYNAISRDALISERSRLPADFMITTLSTRLWRKGIDIAGIRAGGRHVYIDHKMLPENVSAVERSEDSTWEKK